MHFQPKIAVFLFKLSESANIYRKSSPIATTNFQTFKEISKIKKLYELFPFSLIGLVAKTTKRNVTFTKFVLDCDKCDLNIIFVRNMQISDNVYLSNNKTRQVLIKHVLIGFIFYQPVTSEF